MKTLTAPRTLTAAMLLLAAFLALGLFSQTVHNNSHNEQMYVAAGYLLAQGQHLFEDFAFVQMPYSPLIYSLFFRLGGGDYLTTAKLANFAFLAAAAVLLWLIARRETRDSLFAATLLALFLANYYLLRTVIEASNYTMPIAFSLGAYALFLRYADHPRRPLAFFAAGVLLAAAVGAKLYYATLLAPFALAALLYPAAATVRSRILRGLLPLAGGAAAGAIPLFYYAARGWDRFAFNNLGYHLLNTTWREQNGFAPMTWAALLDTARDLLANPSYLLPVVWLALAAVTWAGQAHAAPRRLNAGTPGVLLSTLLLAAALVTAFTPRPLFPQYFAMPAPFLLTLMAALYRAPGAAAAARTATPGADHHRAAHADRAAAAHRLAAPRPQPRRSVGGQRRAASRSRRSASSHRSRDTRPRPRQAGDRRAGLCPGVRHGLLPGAGDRLICAARGRPAQH